MNSAMTLEKVRQGLQKLFDAGPGVACNAFPLAEWIEAIDVHLHLHLADKAGARVDGWMPIESEPTIPEGAYDFFWIAVRRKPVEGVSDKVYVFPAVYCNRYPVSSDDDVPSDSAGAFWQQRVLPEGSDGDITLTGWYEVSSDGDYDSNYRPVCSHGDDILAWHAAPMYP